MKLSPVVCAAAVLIGGAARAQDPPVDDAPGAVALPSPPPPTAFSGSSSARLEWRADNRNGRQDDDHFADAIVRTNLALDGGDTRFAVRIDGEAFAGEPANASYESELRIERVTLDLERTVAVGRGGELRAHLSLGDFYAQFGRGIALSLRRIDELGIDVALRGARADVGTAGGGLVLTVLGGVTNAVNIEQQFLQHVAEPRDPLGGARLEGRVGELALGAHVVGVRDADPQPTGTHRETLMVGGTFDAVIGEASLGFEIDGQRRASFGSRQDGWGAYAVATVPLAARVTLLAEAKHYAGLLPLTGSTMSTGETRFVYNQAPTAERVDQEVVDNTDVTGGRARLDVTFGEENAHSTHGSLGVFRNRATDQWITHGFAGVDFRAASGLAVLVAGGYRREWMIEGGALARGIAHGELDAIVPLGPRLSLHAIARHESHVEANGPSRYVFHRGGASVESTIADRLVLAAGVDWDTQNQAPGIARGFGFGLVRWRQSDAFIVQFLGGSQRGGIRCLAGACRIQPPFAGARLDVTALF